MDVGCRVPLVFTVFVTSAVAYRCHTRSRFGAENQQARTQHGTEVANGHETSTKPTLNEGDSKCFVIECSVQGKQKIAAFTKRKMSKNLNIL